MASTKGGKRTKNGLAPAGKELFDINSGNRLERLIFNNRRWVLLVCALVTAFLGWQMRTLGINTSFEKMLPSNHPFVINYLENRGELRGIGNSLRIAVENTQGDIYDPRYLAELAKINDKIFLMPWVNRAWMKSLYSPVVRWSEVTEEGFAGGPVMPRSYDGSEKSIDLLKQNIARANLVGSLVASDQRSSMLVVPLLENQTDKGQSLDYRALSHALDEIRTTTERDTPYRIHIIGFAKLAGDLIHGLEKVMLFFAAAAAVCALIIFMYTHCLRSTVLVISCSLIAVIWQLGILATLGYPIDPFSILVPFLIFAIGVSHGAQKMNGIMQDIGRGEHRSVAARYTFRRLFVAGVTALLADVGGFAVLMAIDIPVIRELAWAASVGVGILIFTNLILLPVLLSYVGVSPSAASRSVKEECDEIKGRGLGVIWNFLDRFTERRWAAATIAVAVMLAALGYFGSRGLQIGDLDAGAPELRPESLYNKDNAFITTNYGLSSDVFAVMVKTSKDGCRSFETLTEMDRLSWTMQHVPGVQQTASLVDTVRMFTTGGFEGNPKWYTISRDSDVLSAPINLAQNWNSDMLNNDCSLMPVVFYLSDHKAETLTRVVDAAEAFAKEHNEPGRQFLLAAGNAGIEAATNVVVKSANAKMLFYIYAAVSVLCLIAFRSWRAVLVAVLPLALTSILAEALMVKLGIGVKVATLPVIALGVGIGVDYALYLVSVQLAQQRAGLPLAEAYKRAVGITGKVVALVGVMLAAGVFTWAWSPIKFQADMGILLTFMFLLNMVGALILIPALSYFLLKGETLGASAPQQGSSAVPIV